MTPAAFAVLMLVVFGWAVFSDRLARWNITGPIILTVAGFLLSNQDWGALPINVETPSVHLLAEVTLALLLFSDAARVDVTALRRDIRVPARLLLIGLPLTLVLGALAAALLFGDFTWALAGFVGAALAPTDAALSIQVINDKRIPMRIRRTLNVESGLNDGIVTPAVVFALSLTAAELGVGSGHDSVVRPLFEVAVAIVVGLAAGFGGAKAIAFGARRRWILPGGRRLATLAVAVASFSLALALSGNGFIAAFVAGIAFGAGLPRDVATVEEVGELPELLGEMLSLAVWFIFGAALVPVALDYLSVSTLVYAVLSLTVIRMLPVALSLPKTGLDTSTVLFVGWFGPRGLASVVFVLLAIEELGESGPVGTAVAAVTITVLLSVVAHGISAGPLGGRYAARHGDSAPGKEGTSPRSRRRIH